MPQAPTTRTIQLLSRRGASIDTSKFDPRARALFTYRLRIHPSDGLLGRKHFDAGEIAELLPDLSLVEVHRNPLRFRYRLLDSRVVFVGGEELTGRWLHEFYAAEQSGADLINDYARVVESGKPTWRRGEPRIMPLCHCKILEVLRLPRASRGRMIDMILCIHLYFDAAGRPIDRITCVPFVK